MSTKHTFSLLTLAAVILAVPAGAVSRVETNVGTNGPVVSIPEKAIEVAPHVFSLGSAIDPGTGRLVEGYAIVHYRNAKAKGGNGNGNANGNGRGGKSRNPQFNAQKRKGSGQQHRSRHSGKPTGTKEPGSREAEAKEHRLKESSGNDSGTE